jgi:hypothetical protein
MATTAFDMKEALVAQSKLRPALSELADDDAIWDSAYSGASGDRPRKLLWFGEILWAYDQNVAFGRTPASREEEYNIRVGIEINDNDDVQQEANDKAKLILQDLEDMVGHYNLFATAAPRGLVRIGIVPIGLGEGPGGPEGGRAAFMALQVNVTARK